MGLKFELKDLQSDRDTMEFTIEIVDWLKGLEADQYGRRHTERLENKITDIIAEAVAEKFLTEKLMDLVNDIDLNEVKKMVLVRIANRTIDRNY